MIDLRSGFLSGKMKMEPIIEINNLTGRKINAPLIKKAAAAVMEGESKSRGELSLVFVGKNRIRALNKKYRMVDCATDVLSFAHCEGKELVGGRILGELVICPEVVAQDAKQARRAFDCQAAWVAIHGTLHLLGYDHEKNEAAARSMRKKEEEYLSKLRVDF